MCGKNIFPEKNFFSDHFIKKRLDFEISQEYEFIAIGNIAKILQTAL